MVNSQPFKELGGVKSADKLPSSEPFGRPPGGFGEPSPQEYQPGELVMLGTGLYRVNAVESMSVNLHMGLKATVATGSTGTTLNLDIDEGDAAFSSTTAGFQLPAGTKVMLGAQGFNDTNQTVTLASRAEFGRAVGTVTVSGTATNTKTLTIISADGTSKAYVAASTEDLTADPCAFRSTGSKQIVAESIVRCINDTDGGHGGKILAELDVTGTNPVIRLIQVTPGTDGNTTISTTEANISVSSFTGGQVGRINATIEETLAHPVGTEATVLFLPNATFNGGSSYTLDQRAFGILESPDRRKVIYDVTWGISMHPKYIAASGESTNTGISSFDGNDLGSLAAAFSAAGGNTDAVAIDGSGFVRVDGTTETDTSPIDSDGESYDIGSPGGAKHGGNGFGYGFGTAFNGMTSPKIRVFQPRGKVRFTVDLQSGSDNSNKAGWITAEETPIINPNPAYRLVTGSGGNDNTLPFFQLLQDIDEDLRDPRILITGFKYLLKEVSDGEVREMIRRSGRFNYKIIQDPGQMSGFADGITGPTEGWKALVENQRGRRMSFEDYKRATERVTDQTMNMLYGTKSSGVQGRTSDPRNRHRGY